MNTIKLVELPLRKNYNPYFEDIKAIFKETFPSGKHISWDCLQYQMELAHVKQKLKKRIDEKFHLIGNLTKEKIYLCTIFSDCEKI
jgi:hypothetical protein